jgi:hypothetical protein
MLLGAWLFAPSVGPSNDREVGRRRTPREGAALDVGSYKRLRGRQRRRAVFSMNGSDGNTSGTKSVMRGA